MKIQFSMFLIMALLFLAGCRAEKSTCPLVETTENYLTIPPEFLPTPAATSSTPIIMKIRGRNVTVDEIVEGPLCNGTWIGTIYVTCNVQVYPWVDKPLFLKDCNLSIAPDTVVYVAFHNDTAYYKGCSCHTGELEEQ